MTDAEIIAQYVALLIVQYAAKPRARKTIEAFTGEAVASQIFAKVRDAYDVNTAIGEQLDLLASWVGVSRTVYGVDLTHEYFELADYTDSDPAAIARPGFAFYEDPDGNVTVYFFQYADANRPVYSMTDDQLRQVIRFVARLNSGYQSLKDIDDLLFEFFGTDILLEDGMDMTITYIQAGTNTIFSLLSQTNNLPRPAGVELAVA